MFAVRFIGRIRITVSLRCGASRDRSPRARTLRRETGLSRQLPANSLRRKQHALSLTCTQTNDVSNLHETALEECSSARTQIIVSTRVRSAMNTGTIPMRIRVAHTSILVGYRRRALTRSVYCALTALRMRDRHARNTLTFCPCFHIIG